MVRLETVQNTYLSISGIEVWSGTVTTTTTTSTSEEVTSYVSLIGEKPHGCYKDQGKRDLPERLRTEVPR